MENLWLCTVPNASDNVAASTLGGIKRSTGSASAFFDLPIPALQHGTLDSLIALSDDLHKLGPQVESVLKKIERQYFEITEAAGKKQHVLKVAERSVDAYTHHWEWDYARYPYQSRKLNEIVAQISSQAATADEELKKLLATHSEKVQALAAFQRKKTVNLGTSDFEDFLSPAQAEQWKKEVHGQRQPEENSDSSSSGEGPTLMTVMIAMAKHTEEDFLANYAATETNADGWTKDIASYGSTGDRDAVKGSPVVPGSAAKVHEIEGQVLYAITMLRGHSLPGAFDPVNPSVFLAGDTVDYVEPVRRAFREKRCTLRLFSMSDSSGETVDAQIERCSSEVAHSASTIARWSSAQFSDVLVAYMHLRAVTAHVESALRYGVPVDICAFLVRPHASAGPELQAALTTAVLQQCPRLAESFDDEDEEADLHVPFVLQQFQLPNGTNSNGVQQ